MNIGILSLLALLVVLVGIALVRRQDFAPVLRRFIEQFAKLVPRMLCALVAAGFIATLIPKELIAGFLGPDAGLIALPVAARNGVAGACWSSESHLPLPPFLPRPGLRPPR